MFISRSAEETFARGAETGAGAKRGSVFALTGDLGAGKTQFVKGLVRGIESNAEVTSPTFTLVHEYPGGRLPVYHLDFYRLDDPNAAVGLGFDDYVYGDGVCVIEWADRFPELMPQHARWIAFRVLDETSRGLEGVEPS